MTPLSVIKSEDWQQYRRVARRYERELRRIMQATACNADHLRVFAEKALAVKKKVRKR